MTAHRHRWTAPDRPDVLECADCGAICTWDPTDRSTHPDARREREATPERKAPPERKPSAGWVDRGGLRTLGDRSHIVRGAVRQYVDGCDWSITVPGCDGVGGRYGKAPTLDAAKLAAEDALLAIAAEIVGAVGR